MGAGWPGTETGSFPSSELQGASLLGWTPKAAMHTSQIHNAKHLGAVDSVSAIVLAISPSLSQSLYLEWQRFSYLFYR